MRLVTSDLFAKLPRLPSILRVGAAARTPLHRNLRADSIDAAHTWERRSFALQRFFNCRKRKNVTIFLAIELSLRHSLQCQPRSRSASTIRFAAYMDGLAKAAGHADRKIPLRSYCTGLLLPGERKSVEPMAARLAPDNVRRMHQSLHHVVADAPWSDKAVLGQVRNSVLPALQKRGIVVCWLVDDTGFPKKGIHSVGVARQYCGQVGKQDNYRVAVSLSVAT
jgi:hypothetical protein